MSLEKPTELEDEKSKADLEQSSAERSELHGKELLESMSLDSLSNLYGTMVDLESKNTQYWDKTFTEKSQYIERLEGPAAEFEKKMLDGLREEHEKQKREHREYQNLIQEVMKEKEAQGAALK